MGNSSEGEEAPNPAPSFVLALATVTVLLGVVIGWAAVALMTWIGGLSGAALLLAYPPTRARLGPSRRKSLIGLIVGGFLASNVVGVLAAAKLISVPSAVLIAVAWSLFTALLGATWAFGADHKARP